MGASSLGDPQSLNLYAYCGNDPINHTDPDGLFFKKLFSAFGKALRFLFKVIAVVLAVAVLAAGSPGGVLILLGLATVFGIAGWHNGKLGNFVRTLLLAGGANSKHGGFKTPSTFGNGSSNGVNGFLAEKRSVWAGRRVFLFAILGALSRFIGSSQSKTFDKDKVYKCKRPVRLKLGGVERWLNHYWLKTNGKEAGLGPLGGGIPGQNSDSPYITQTSINDHTGQADLAESTCEIVRGVEPEAINKLLEIGKPMGRWTATNNCFTLVNQVIFEASWGKNGVNYPLTYEPFGNIP
jgi:hypothetical protein